MDGHAAVSVREASQGKDIGRILGATQRGEGCLNGSGVTVTWCIGHLVEAAAPEVYDAALKRWSLEQLPIIPPAVAGRGQTEDRHAIQGRQSASGEGDPSCHRHRRRPRGELIAREIIDLCGYRGPIERLWLSALNDASIRTALAKLRPSAETLPMYYSALARSRADWLVGMNLSRLFTVLGRQAGYDGVLSVGRVQTRRSNSWWTATARSRPSCPCRTGPSTLSLSAGGQTFTAQWVAPDASTDDAGRCLRSRRSRPRSRSAPRQCPGGVGRDRARARRPAAAVRPGHLAGSLFQAARLDVQEDGTSPRPCTRRTRPMTYPRSDSGYLPESMFAEVPTVLDSLLKTDPTLAQIMGQLDRTPALARLERRQVTAHHGIIPTLEPANLSAMSEGTGVVPADRAHYLPSSSRTTSSTAPWRISPAASRSWWLRASRSSPAAGAWCWPSPNVKAAPMRMATPRAHPGAACAA